MQSLQKAKKNYKPSESAILKMNRHLISLSSKLGREANFADIIENSIKVKGYDYAKKYFDIHSKIYKATERTIDNQTEIYNDYFNDESTYSIFEEDFEKYFGEKANRRRKQIPKVKIPIVKKQQRPKIIEKVEEDTKEGFIFEKAVKEEKETEEEKRRREQEEEDEVASYLSPKRVTTFKPSASVMLAMTNYLKSLSFKLGREANFVDLIEHRIKVNGYDETENNFSGYSKIYKALGRKIDNEKQIYNNYFNLESNASIFETEINNHSELEPVEEEETREINNEIQEEVKEVINPKEFDEEGNIVESVKVEEDGRTNYTRLGLTTERVKNLLGYETSRIVGIDFNEERNLIDSLKNLIVKSIDFNQKGLGYKDIKNSILQAPDKYLKSILDSNKVLLKTLKDLDLDKQDIDNTSLDISKIEEILDQKDKLIDSLDKEFNNIFSVNFSEEEKNIEEGEEEEHNFSKSFLERDIKMSYSGLLKLSLFGINKKFVGTGNEEKGFLGLNKFHNANDVILKLLDITTSIPSSWSLLEKSLDDKFKKTGDELYIDIKNRLNNLSEQIKNEFLYKNIGKKLTIWKMLSSPGKITLLDENSEKETIKLKQQIINGFTSGNFAKNIDGKLFLNKERTIKILRNLGNILKEGNTNKKDIRKIFKDIGLGSFNNNTIDYLIKQHLQKGKYEESLLFGRYKGLLGLFYRLMKNNLTYNKSEISLEDNKNNPFRNMGTPLKNLIDAEILLNKSFVAKSINVAGKMMQSVIANTSIYDSVSKIIDNPDLIKSYLSCPYTSNNYWLKMLLEDEKYKKIFKEIGFSSPEALKVSNKNSNMDTDFDKLSPQDNLSTILGLFMNERGPVLSEKYYFGLNFRLGQMPIQTISDKGRMVYMRVPILDIDSSDFDENTKTLESNVTDFLYDQLFTPEFKRIQQSYAQNTNIKNYDKSSKIFHLIPSFNSIIIDTKENGPVPIINMLRDHNGNAIKEEYLQQIKKEAVKRINDYVLSETDKFITADGKTGMLRDYNFYDKNGKIHYLNSSYINNKFSKNTVKNLRVSMSEFVINDILSKMSSQQLFLGDRSFYCKDNLIPEIGSEIDGKEMTKPEIYGNIAKKTATLVQKRAAMLIAPGLKLSNSEDPTSNYSQNFLHLAVNDVESMSSSMKELIENQYGKFNKEKEKAWNRIQELKKEINDLRKEDEDINQDKIEKRLKEINNIKRTEFSEIADYFNITGTDAQEYCTWKSHLDMLLRKGQISRDQHDNLEIKINNGESLNEEEMNVVLQPSKPVTTGILNENGIMRPIYIKSSVFPLLPSLTANLKIDEVRKKIEILEKEKGIPVRISYQSANKIGSRDTNLNMNDLYTQSLETLKDNGIIDNASTIIPMSFFKIQQETASKEDKAYKDGKRTVVTMGSQIFKILFGNFINHVDKPSFENFFSKEIIQLSGLEDNKNDSKLTGKDLYKIYTEVYKKYSDLQKYQLEEELGFDKWNFNDSPINIQNSIIENLQKILLKEINQRDYPNYLKDAIGIIRKKNRSMIESTLMFDNNRHKFEALLQAIISNRLITNKLPGNSHIVASSEGFEKKTNLDKLTSKQKKGIVWTDNYQSELKSTFVKDKDGVKTTSKSQVLIKSHIRVTDEEGNLKYVDLTSDEYSKNILNDKGEIVGRQLIKEKISEELLSNFSFRIPTGSHQAGSIIQIAGFIPPECGDLLIVPKEHTIQIGEGNDFDKRYLYKSNYFVNKKTGKIDILRGKIIKENTQQFDNFLKAVFGEQYEEVKDISPNYFERKKRLLLLENALINVYKSIYNSSDTDIQKRIFKPLNTDIAEETANLMDKKLTQSEDMTNFNPMSFDYQQKLLENGSDGNIGIGKHSNAVTFEAQMQRLSEENKIQLLIEEEVKVDNRKTTKQKPLTLNIGGLVFKGIFGKERKTLDGKREISDLHNENQNVNTDNVSKQVMSKRNENSYTMGVYAMMAHMGYDMSLDSVNTGQIITPLHVPSLLINHPIIRDYVRLKKHYDSLTNDYIGTSKEKEIKIIEELKKKYNLDISDINKFLSERFEGDKELTGQFLWDNLDENVALQNKTRTKNVLKTFLIIDKQSRKMSKIQQLLNLSSTKLGISYFDVVQRINSLDAIIDNQQSENNNFTRLIGEYSFDPKKGYTKIGSYYWKPTTVEGTMLLNSLETAEKVMPIFFPYSSPAFSTLIHNIFTNSSKDSTIKSKYNTKWKYEIMTEFVNFINSDIGVFKGEIEQERKRLFFDYKDNLSLGSILQQLKNSNHPLMQNLFLKDLSFEKSIITGINEILSVNIEETSFDKSSKYESFLDLLKDDSYIKDNKGNPILFNGEKYKVSDIAQDLISYSYLSNDRKGATGFKSFIPSQYLSLIGVYDNYRSIFNTLKNDKKSDDGYYSPFVEDVINNFTQQYLQHFPERAYLIDNTKETLSILESMGYSDKPKYVSIKDNTKDNTKKKYKLFNYDGIKKRYVEIPILGNKGAYNEYNFTSTL